MAEPTQKLEPVEVKTLLGSGSQLDRTLECPASWHLPQVRERSENAVKAAGRGTQIHAWAADPNFKEHKLPDEIRAEVQQIDRDQLVHTHATHVEIALAWDGFEGDARVLGEELDRDYQIEKPEETPCTLDAVVVGYRMAEVWDLKTGKTKPPKPDEAAQLLHGALCVSETLAPRASHFVVGFQRLMAKGRLENHAAIVDRFALEEYEQRHRRAQQTALKTVGAVEAGEDPPVNPGPWCRFCEAKPVCPEYR